MDWLNQIRELIIEWRLVSISRAIFFFIVGFFAARLASSFFERVINSRLDKHQVNLARRAVYYFVLILFSVSALNELGFNLQVLLGAAGVLTVAMGFASQTSASNLISGLFITIERPFSIGDVIKIGSTTGEIVAIDLLSTKLRTFDNLYVRIPNETMIKSEVTALTKFPIRRLDLTIGVAYKENLSRVSEVLFQVADKNTLCLDEPKPLIINQGFQDSSIDLLFCVWAKRENLLSLRNSIYTEIKEAFDEHGIEIPFPHRSLYTGEVTKPFPIVVVPPNEGS